VIPGSVSSGILTRVRTSPVRSRVRIRRPAALAGSLRQAFRRSGLLLGPSDFCNKETMARARRGISEALASRLRRVLYGVSGIFSISLRTRKREEALLARSIASPSRLVASIHSITRSIVVASMTRVALRSLTPNRVSHLESTSSRVIEPSIDALTLPCRDPPELHW
jgi:hypothetical protein